MRRNCTVEYHRAYERSHSGLLRENIDLVRVSPKKFISRGLRQYLAQKRILIENCRNESHSAIENTRDLSSGSQNNQLIFET